MSESSFYSFIFFLNHKFEPAIVSELSSDKSTGADPYWNPWAERELLTCCSILGKIYTELFIGA